MSANGNGSSGANTVEWLRLLQAEAQSNESIPQRQIHFLVNLTEYF